jgi:phosphoserine phosphatase RsbU/P
MHAGRWQRRWMAGWLALTCALSVAAQTRGNSQGAAPVDPNGVSSAPVRYESGDDPRFADPAYDDTNWTASSDGRWSLPEFDTEGIVWVRMRVTVPPGANGPLAMQTAVSGAHPVAEQVFVNGRLVGGEGGFPPQEYPVYMPLSAVYDLPPGTAAPGTQAVVAVRMWYLPRARQRDKRRSGTSARGDVPNAVAQFACSVGSADQIRLAARAEHLSNTLGSIPDFALNALLGLVGVALLVFWRWSRRYELALCGALLISYPVYESFFLATDLCYLSVPNWIWAAGWVTLTVATMAVTVEFLWTVHGLRAPGLRRATHAAWIVFNVTGLYADLATHASPLVHGVLILNTWSVQIFNVITLGVNLWVFFVRRYNRVIAAAMAIIPVGSALAYLGYREHWLFGYADISLFDVGSVLSGFAIAAMLIQRAVKAWREGNDLRVEFEAAREVQQQLVMEAPQIPGFTIESVYAPAQQVGGVLLVVGDVSGKGLRAAMTVSAIMGALRTMPSAAPAEILAVLNRSLTGNLHGGLVTCCVAQIARDGTVTAANAGHLAPYCNGEEVSFEPGLPLGVVADAEYVACRFALEPGDTLTFLSDGVVEAQSASGELFGFERTRAISGLAADKIAAAAQQFGQQDDITVLTLTLIGAEVVRA